MDEGKILVELAAAVLAQCRQPPRPSHGTVANAALVRKNAAKSAVLPLCRQYQRFATLTLPGL